MLGSTVFHQLQSRPDLAVYGTARSNSVRQFFPRTMDDKILIGADADNTDSIVAALNQIRPEVIVNCIGIIKQTKAAKDPLVALPINSIFPHRLARLATLLGARVVHISTDCVFSGKKGNYSECDTPDADDLYGRSKLMGELDAPNAITLRTSIIGRELIGRKGLLDWFLGEREPVKGYAGAVFSGLTTDELARLIQEHVLSRPDLTGILHVGGEAITKFELLNLIKSAYGVATIIQRDDTVVIDRSLDSTRFREATGYRPPCWREMIRRMIEQGRPAQANVDIH
jgi:dTDP-4-dehydrorhamnose reductase